jgi:beta-lactam-binding protein with PASTA domain/tRNA A-37 threonylcarbamoyl transferase component Bud32
VSESSQVGRVLGGRYRLIAPIGIGASGQVYLADDTRLQRQVAVKVLHRALADDEVFLRRFRAEAQMAAGLHHPHVVTVHDWGGDEVPYIVTEYLAGGSLRAMLDEAGTLSPSQALLVGLGAAQALEYAHKRGVVQRDIKPANLLFDADANVRIADFGLAKALAEASATEPSGSMLGTVRYASPEQARGRSIGPASDVYSLGLVLIEAVTGSLPFDADTPIGTLMARVDARVALDPAVLGSLREPLERATCPDPAHRIDAGTLHRMLLQAAEGMPRPAPLPLAGAVRFDPATTVPVDPTLIGAGVDGDGGRHGARPGGRRRRWRAIVGIAVLLAAIAAGTVFALQSAEVATREVPSAEGMTVAEFRAAVGDFWQLEEHFDRLDDSVPGTILRTDPPAGTALAEGTLLSYFVSEGNALRTVPTNLLGLPLADAEAFLKGADLDLGVVSRRYDEAAAIDVVIEVQEARVQVERDTPVNLVVSDGPAPRVVPDDLVGKSLEDATAQLALLGLGVTSTEAYDSEIDKGHVVSHEPQAGTEVERDSVIAVVVSKGPEPVVIPNLAGRSATDAASILESVGLCESGVRGPLTTPVIGTDPPAGTTVDYGTCVDIVTSTR